MKNNEEELKTVEFTLDESNGDNLFAVSIVNDPAIEKSFQLFKALKFKKEDFKSSTDKMEITGPVMIPDLKILRFNETSNEYYNCIFSKDTVKECASIYLKNCNHISANFNHTDIFTKNIFVIESWIVTNPELDKSKALGFDDITEGTWMMTYKVTDKELWKEIKAGDFSGFSIEGWFSNFEKLQADIIKEKLIYQILMSNLNNEDKELFFKKFSEQK